MPAPRDEYNDETPLGHELDENLIDDEDNYEIEDALEFDEDSFNDEDEE